jgi:hypothetical protein
MSWIMLKQKAIITIASNWIIHVSYMFDMKLCNWQLPTPLLDNHTYLWTM